MAYCTIHLHSERCGEGSSDVLADVKAQFQCSAQYKTLKFTAIDSL